MNIFELVKKEVNKISPDSEVILFGSRARGNYREDSDWDFLILTQDNAMPKNLKKKIRDRLYDIELETNEVISTIIHSKKEWEALSVTPIYQIIKEEGKRA